MKLMFKKSYGELKALLSGIEGVWEESQKNKKVLRLNGGVMNWYESTGTNVIKLSNKRLIYFALL